MIKQLCVVLALLSAAAGAQAQTQGEDADNAQTNAPRARVSGTAPTNQVVVTGVVPNENTKAVVLKRLRAIYGDDRVIDEVTIGDVVAPPNWETYLDRMLVSDLSNVSRGKLVIKGNDAQISGDVVNEAQRQDIVSRGARRDHHRDRIARNDPEQTEDDDRDAKKRHGRHHGPVENSGDRHQNSAAFLQV